MGKSIFGADGFLTRLRRNQAGNTIAIVAAMIIPLMGLIGGGIDMSRIYLTKARLQQACDAGALAGRKQMGAGAWSANNNQANTVALQLFDANFKSGSYGTDGTQLTRSFSESNGKVTGVASQPVPMTIMKIFGQTSKTLSVTCDAEMRIPNTDVMFVLDNTGSMGDTNPGDTDTKINGLKKAVKCFYEALMKVDTTANCGSTPSGGNGSTVQLRFGFVPYNVNVNVGRLLNNDWIADNWTYQSRQYTATGTYTSSSSAGSWAATGSGTKSSQNYSGQSSCPADTFTQTTGTPVTSSSTAANGTITTTTTTTRTSNGIDYSNCTSSGFLFWVTYSYTKTTYTNYVEQKVDTATQTPNYTYVYQPVSLNISGLKAGGSSWNSSVSLPVGTNGTNVAVNWDGCIEERQTVRATSYDPIPSGAKDLDIDMVPSTSDATTQWGPMLPDAVWGRVNSSGNNNYSSVTTTSDLAHNINYFCPQAARKLQTYPTAAPFEAYVDSLYPNGNTYHDTAMIWGARLMSPTGIFASENATTSNGGQIQRHLIFMTDGDTVTNNQDYSAYGVPWWDRRETAASASPNNSQLTDQVNMRLLAMCKAVKNKNITLWVISFGTGVSSTAQTNLQTCASPGRYYNAANSTDLINQFKAIADEISQLRLTN